METIAVQQVRSEVDPVQELVIPCEKILLAKQIKSSKKTLQDFKNIFAQHDNNLGRTKFCSMQILNNGVFAGCRLSQDSDGWSLA